METAHSQNTRNENKDFKLKPLPLEGVFPFSCYPGITCFNHCCKDIDILLTPLDIIKLKKSQRIPSSKFLETHVWIHNLPETHIPLVRLKMKEGDRRSCVFLDEEKDCGVYENRPTVCRSYPLGFGLTNRSFDEEHEKHFMIIEPMCHGHREKQEWTLERWKKDQGVDSFEELNKNWIELVVKLKTSGGKEMKDPQRTWFMMASYDMDTFREFVSRSSFYASFNLDEKTISETKADDESLLRLALDWQQFMFFHEGPLKLQGSKE